ncbi:MAG: hypothetical protein AAF899_00490 [Pseudomonadota bacterium]
MTRQTARRIVCAVLVLLSVAAERPSVAQSGPQLRLADDLDFPGEGYCVDVVGVGAGARADLPLVAHNCLPERNVADRIVVQRDDTLVMPSYDACVTAFGVTAPLPGSPLILRPCGGREHFLPAGALQRFERTAEDRLRLAGTALCLAVGPDAAPTYSAVHRWRTLTMERCDTVPAALSVWD